MSIEVAGLVKYYGAQKAVDQLSFSVNKGEIVGFLGPNGAGKTTTLKMITGFLPPDEGSIQICGINMQQYPIDCKRKIGYLPEANPLYTNMYLKEYLAFVAGVHGIGSGQWTADRGNKTVDDIIKKVGVDAEQHKKIGELSKGYKQRVGLAAAILHNPAVIVLDEPTSGLDPNQIIEIRNLIKELGKDKTVLFSSHILQEVEAICSRVIIIHKGKIVADDQLENLTAKNSLEKVFHSLTGLISV